MENMEAAQPTTEPTGEAPAGAQEVQAPAEADSFDWEAIKGREIEVDIDGQPTKVPLDELRRGYQRRQASDRRFEEAAHAKREVETAIRAFNENPVEGLKKLKATEYFKQNPRALVELVGEDVFQNFAEETLWQKIQRERRMQENPYEVQAEEYKRQLDEIRQREEAEKQRLEKETMTRQEQEAIAEARTTIEKQIHDALSKSSLPATPETVARYARIYKSALQNGYEPAPEDIVAKVEESYMSEIQKLMGQLPEDKASKFLGDDFVKKLRQADLQRLRGVGDPVGGVPRGGQQQASGGKGPVTPEDYFAEKRKRLGL